MAWLWSSRSIGNSESRDGPSHGDDQRQHWSENRSQVSNLGTTIQKGQRTETQGGEWEEVREARQHHVQPVQRKPNRGKVSKPTNLVLMRERVRSSGRTNPACSRWTKGWLWRRALGQCVLPTPSGSFSEKRKGENGVKFEGEVGLRDFFFFCYGQDLNVSLGWEKRLS